MIAIYRLLYGEEFIEQSIRSILDHVTRVYVYYTNKPWTKPKGVMYRGEWVEFPAQFDKAAQVVRDMNEPKIRLINNYFPTPFNQFSYLVYETVRVFGPVDEVLIIEPDMVMKKWPTGYRSPSATPQTEWWKTDYKIPQRARPGPIFLKPPVSETGANGWPANMPVEWNDGEADNYGFCLSDQAMYWKHLTAMAFSPKIGDSIPNPDWYEDVWLKWTPEMKNLEISLGRESAIPFAR